MEVGRSASALPAALTLLLAGCALFGKLPDGPLAVSVAERSGRVLIIREPSYVVAVPGIAIEIGDRVATLAKASATLRYTLLDERGVATDRGCEVELPPNSELLVTGGGDCAAPSITSLNDADESPAPGDGG